MQKKFLRTSVLALGSAFCILATMPQTGTAMRITNQTDQKLDVTVYFLISKPRPIEPKKVVPLSTLRSDFKPGETQECDILSAFLNDWQIAQKRKTKGYTPFLGVLVRDSNEKVIESSEYRDPSEEQVKQFCNNHLMIKLPDQEK